MFVHDNVQTVGDYNGYTTNVNDNDEATNSFIRRQQVNNNNLWVNQLLFDYKFSEKISVNASAGYNMIRGSEPDRKTNSYDYRNGQYYVGTNSSALNHRFFSILDEDDVVGKLEGSYVFNPESELQKTLIVGTNFRNTQRTFQSIQFNYDFPSNNVAVDIDNPEAVFNQENLNNNVFYLETGRGYDPSTAFNPYYYIADRTIVGGYTQFTYPVSEKLIFQAGLRFENIEQLINWDTNISSSVNNLTTDPAKIDKTYLLPSLNAKYSINDDKALRFAASQTYTLPQFKENAAFLYEDVNFSEFGNPYLIPSTNYNVDVKYDWFFSKTELISLGGFYKYIQDPINRIRVASAANELSYVNSGTAFVTGAELEARKTLYSFATEESENANDLSFGLNMSYLYSEQKNTDTDTDNITVLFTNEKSKLQGATPLLINSDISYNFKNEKNALTSTLVFNYFYDKVYSIGTSENENIIEKSVPTLDFVNKFEFVKNKLTLNLAIKNLLNPKYRLTQDTTKDGIATASVVQSYKKGMFISFGLNWNL